MTYPFSYSESFNLVDVGLVLIVNSRCYQSGIISIRCLNALLAGRLGIWLVGNTNQFRKSWIPISLIDGGAVGNAGSCLGGLPLIANALQ